MYGTQHNRMSQGSAWGHCLFQGTYPLPNYRPLILNDPQKKKHPHNILNTKVSTKVTRVRLDRFLYNECHVLHKHRVNTSITYKVLPPLSSSFDVEQILAPKCLHTPLLLYVAGWQWVPIQIQVPPPPPSVQ